MSADTGTEFVDRVEEAFIRNLKKRLEENDALKETVEKNSTEKAQMKFENVTRTEMLDMIDQNTAGMSSAQGSRRHSIRWTRSIRCSRRLLASIGAHDCFDPSMSCSIFRVDATGAASCI